MRRNANLVIGLVLAAVCLLGAIGLVISGQAIAGDAPGCLERAAAWADVHPTLLRAIAWVESRGDYRALNWNRNGSYDVGLMQINSDWYYRGLEPWWMGLGSPCVNVAAGAWVLRQCTDVYHYTWDAVGCYHAGEGWRRGRRRRAAEIYVRKVQAALGLRLSPVRSSQPAMAPRQNRAAAPIFENSRNLPLTK